MNKGLVALIGAGLFAMCGVGALVVTSGDADPPQVEISVPPSPSGERRAVPQKPHVSQRPQTIRPGTWVVGEDVKAGKYRTTGAVEGPIAMCYWDVRTGSETADIEAQGVKGVGEPGLVTLRKGQYFTTSGCSDWIVRP